MIRTKTGSFQSRPVEALQILSAINIESQPKKKGKRVDLGDLALAAEGACPSVSIVPRNTAALDRVPSQAISARLVQ